MLEQLSFIIGSHACALRPLCVIVYRPSCINSYKHAVVFYRIGHIQSFTMYLTYSFS